MEGSATKVPELNDCDAAQIRKTSSSIVSRMYVEGYDTSKSGYDLVTSMKEHFASCGDVLHVYIPGYSQGTTLNRFALMYLRGEGAEEKAMILDGICMGGHKLVVEPYPFHATHLDHKFAPTRDADNKKVHTMSVDGFDTSLPLEHAKSMLYQELTKCGGDGSVERVTLCEKEEGKGVLCSSAVVHVRGIDAVERLLRLCGCDRKGLEDIKVYRVAPPQRVIRIHFDPKRFPPSSRTRVRHEDPGLPKPPCLSELHPPACKGRVFNTQTRASSSRYAPEDPTLPEPWKGLVDNSTGYGYFWNTDTNVTQWKRPS
ncbi:unnamed protein product [Microthlaspi erraticum]|uniref:WW domain-containing protein n=1 Tax=Microthlaspi erraticum TaxID=1685480 RepID=A0A6D2KVJ5_9BRAS|nr:unnamed protein product [Microthlaspi erraticum]